MRLFEEKEKNKQLYMTYIIFLINGMLALSIGALLPFIREAKGLEYAFSGMLVSLHSVGNLISSFFGGALAVRFGRKRSILFFNACLAISYLMILVSGNMVCLVLAFLMTGLARGATSNFCNAVINDLAPGKAGIVNGLHAMFSVGAFIFPIILMGITSSSADNWTYACVLMLVMGVISWILYFLIPVQNQVAQKEKGSSSLGFFKEPMFYLVIVTMFFYLCAEQGVIGWLVTYFKDTGLLSASLSQLMASVQWIMILAGRLTVVWLSARIKKEKLLPVMGVGLVVFFLLLINSNTTPWIVVGIMGFGFSMAGIYPTTVSFSGKLNQKYPLCWSFILTIASMGSILMPSVIGRIAESAGIGAGMSSVAVAVVVDLICIIALVTYSSKKSKREETA